jgi:hypothetical protein
MARLPTLQGATQPQDDLLGLGYCFSNHFGLDLENSANKGVIYKASIRAAEEDGASRVCTGANFEANDQGLVMKLDLSEMEKLKGVFEYTPPENKMVKLTSELAGDFGKTDSITASLSTEFTAENPSLGLS